MPEVCMPIDVDEDIVPLGCQGKPGSEKYAAVPSEDEGRPTAADNSGDTT